MPQNTVIEILPLSYTTLSSVSFIFCTSLSFWVGLVELLVKFALWFSYFSSMQLHMGSPHCPGECRNQIKYVFISNKSVKAFLYLLVFFSYTFTPVFPLLKAEPKFLVWYAPLNGWKDENEICKSLLESQVRPKIRQQDTSKKLKTALKMNPNLLADLQGQWMELGGWFGLKRFLRLQSWKMEIAQQHLPSLLR